MPRRTLSAHNPMTGPRHLGHYASTMVAWPRHAAEGELNVVVDDVISALLYPKGRDEVESRTLAVVRECLALDVDFSKHHLSATSTIPRSARTSVLRVEPDRRTVVPQTISGIVCRIALELSAH